MIEHEATTIFILVEVYHSSKSTYTPMAAYTSVAKAKAAKVRFEGAELLVHEYRIWESVLYSEQVECETCGDALVSYEASESPSLYSSEA